MTGEPWPTVAARHARLIRPFPTKRLHEVLYHVSQESAAIDKAVTRLLIDHPADAEAWRFEVYALMASLASLRARCGDAMPVLEQMAGNADADHRRAVDAMVLVLRGMGEAQPAEQEAA